MGIKRMKKRLNHVVRFITSAGKVKYFRNDEVPYHKMGKTPKDADRETASVHERFALSVPDDSGDKAKNPGKSRTTWRKIKQRLGFSSKKDCKMAEVTAIHQLVAEADLIYRAPEINRVQQVTPCGNDSNNNNNTNSIVDDLEWQAFVAETTRRQLLEQLALKYPMEACTIPPPPFNPRKASRVSHQDGSVIENNMCSSKEELDIFSASHEFTKLCDQEVASYFPDEPEFPTQTLVFPQKITSPLNFTTGSITW